MSHAMHIAVFAFVAYIVFAPVLAVALGRYMKKRWP